MNNLDRSLAMAVAGVTFFMVASAAVGTLESVVREAGPFIVMGCFWLSMAFGVAYFIEKIGAWEVLFVERKNEALQLLQQADNQDTHRRNSRSEETAMAVAIAVVGAMGVRSIIGGVSGLANGDAMAIFPLAGGAVVSYVAVYFIATSLPVLFPNKAKSAWEAIGGEAA